jgi:hypothetical protein
MRLGIGEIKWAAFAILLAGKSLHVALAGLAGVVAKPRLPLFAEAGDFASLGFLAVDADRRRPNSPATGILAERLRPCPLFEGRSIVNRTTNC